MKSKINIKQLSKKASKWVASKEGRLALEQAVQNTEKATSKLEKERKIDSEDLHRQFTL
jgi:hypothetical protein